MSDPILDAFDHLHRRSPRAPWVISTRHEASVSRVQELALAAGAALAEGSFVPGTLVGLASPNGPGFLAGLLALRRAGLAALLYDWRSPASGKQRIGRALGAAAMLVCHRAWPRDRDDFSLVGIDGDRGSLAVLEPDIAVVKLTSGSTGTPRGILTPGAALVADDAALASTMGLVAGDRILAAIPMSHSYGLSSVAMPALMRGSVLVVPEGGKPLDPVAAVRSLEVTFLPTVPAYLQALVKMSSPPPASPALRLVVTAGAPLRPATATRFRDIYGHSVHVFYGSSESGGITFDRKGTAGERGSLGSPVDGVRLTLETGPGEEGSRGTVTVRSAAVARAYHPGPDRCDGDAPGEPRLAGGCFRTRDLAELRDGELYLEGRLDELINIRGKKVNPKEVDAILGQLAGVEDVVTLGVVPPGQDETIVRAFVACRPGSLTYEAVQAWCRRHLAEHKVPRSIVFLEEIPRTGRGKLDRGALLRFEPDRGHE